MNRFSMLMLPMLLLMAVIDAAVVVFAFSGGVVEISDALISVDCRLLFCLFFFTFGDF